MAMRGGRILEGVAGGRPRDGGGRSVAAVSLAEARLLSGEAGEYDWNGERRKSRRGADAGGQSPQAGGRGQSMGVMDPAVRAIRVQTRRVTARASGGLVGETVAGRNDDACLMQTASNFFFPLKSKGGTTQAGRT